MVFSTQSDYICFAFRIHPYRMGASCSYVERPVCKNTNGNKMQICSLVRRQTWSPFKGWTCDALIEQAEIGQGCAVLPSNEPNISRFCIVLFNCDSRRIWEIAALGQESVNLVHFHMKASRSLYKINNNNRKGWAWLVRNIISIVSDFLRPSKAWFEFGSIRWNPSNTALLSKNNECIRIVLKFIKKRQNVTNLLELIRHNCKSLLFIAHVIDMDQ